jgi:hypothetical protein
MNAKKPEPGDRESEKVTEQVRSARGLCRNPYENIDLSLGTINAVIIAGALSIIALIVLGIVGRS